MKITRRSFLFHTMNGLLVFAAALFLGASAAGARAADAPAGAKPNFVIILADDLGYCDTGLYGCKDIPTPNINSIAAHGTLFTDGYVTAGTCSPSRAALMTGRYQERYGFEFNAGPLPRSIRGEFGLPLTEITLAQELKTAGYATGMVGKWHIGMVERFHPMNRGFQEYFGFLFGAHAYLNTKDSFRAGDQNPILRGRTAVYEPEYLTEAFAREAVDFIGRHKQHPFFLYVPFNAPHLPLEATKKYLDRFAGVADPKRRTYMAMVSALDDGVGRILDKLRTEELTEKTVVVFLSDNGCATYTNACTNDPLRLGKTTLFEGGVRIPFAIQWPGKIPEGVVFHDPVSSLDIFPTFLKLAGRELPTGRAYDGVDLMPYLTKTKTGAPHEILFWRNGPNKAVRRGNLKMFFNGEFTWLFDLSADQGEMKNLAADKPELVKELKDAYAKWESQAVAPLWPSRPGENQRSWDVDGHKVEIHV